MAGLVVPDAVATVPVVEMHVHLEGTLNEATARRLATRAGTLHRLPDFGWTGPGWRWPGPRDWLSAMRRVCDATLVDVAAYAEALDDYAARLGDEGVLYVEISVALRRVRAIGIPPDDLLCGLSAAARAATRRTGVGIGLIVSLVAETAPGEMLADADAAIRAAPDGAVVGVDVQAYPLPGAHGASAALALARDAGLGTRVHAGEFEGPATVEMALDWGADRIAHGIRAVERKGLLARIADAGVTLDICPSSNIALGVVATWDAHPLRRLVDAGIRVTLGSDDPAFFGTSAAGEYSRAAHRLGFTAAELRRISLDAVAASFATPPVRKRLAGRIAACPPMEAAIA